MQWVPLMMSADARRFALSRLYAELAALAALASHQPTSPCDVMAFTDKRQSHPNPVSRLED